MDWDCLTNSNKYAIGLLLKDYYKKYRDEVKQFCFTVKFFYNETSLTTYTEVTGDAKIKQVDSMQTKTLVKGDKICIFDLVTLTSTYSYDYMVIGSPNNELIFHFSKGSSFQFKVLNDEDKIVHMLISKGSTLRGVIDSTYDSNLEIIPTTTGDFLNADNRGRGRSIEERNNEEESRKLDNRDINLSRDANSRDGSRDAGCTTCNPLCKIISDLTSLRITVDDATLVPIFFSPSEEELMANMYTSYGFFSTIHANLLTGTTENAITETEMVKAINSGQSAYLRKRLYTDDSIDNIDDYPIVSNDNFIDVAAEGILNVKLKIFREEMTTINGQIAMRKVVEMIEKIEDITDGLLTQPDDYITLGQVLTSATKKLECLKATDSCYSSIEITAEDLAEVPTDAVLQNVQSLEISTTTTGLSTPLKAQITTLGGTSSNDIVMAQKIVDITKAWLDNAYSTYSVTYDPAIVLTPDSAVNDRVIFIDEIISMYIDINDADELFFEMAVDKLKDLDQIANPLAMPIRKLFLDSTSTTYTQFDEVWGDPDC